MQRPRFPLVAAVALAVLAALLGPAALAPPAAAATRSRLEPPELDRFLRWGPLRVRPLLEVRDLGYDDNIFSDNANRVADYRATVAPEVEGLVLLGRRAFVEFDGGLGYTAYAENGDQNFLDRELDARITLPLRRFGFFVDGRRAVTRERPADREDIRPTRRDRGWGAGAIVELGWRTELELGAGRTRTRYEDPDANSIVSDRLDRDERDTYLLASYTLAGRSRLTFRTERTERDFLRLVEVDGVFVDRDSSGWRSLLGVEIGRGGGLWGRVELGWATIDADDPSLATFDAWVGEAQVTYWADSRTRLFLRAERSPGFAVFEDQVYTLQESADLRAVRFLNRVFGLEAGLGYGTLTFPGAGGTVTRRDNIDSYSAGIRLRGLENALGSRVEYSLRLRRSERDSTLDSRDRTQTTVVINAELGF